jgi:cellulose synthase/poly-beta-1,6-N-acetylglucosamine synthase-like glycosyltransferase
MRPPNLLHTVAKNFPVPLTVLKIQRRGKSAAMNDALRVAHGTVVAFLDDDVVVQSNWLCAVQQFFREKDYQVDQGVIRLRPAVARPKMKETDTGAKGVFITISECSRPNSRTVTARDTVAPWWPILLRAYSSSASPSQAN